MSFQDQSNNIPKIGAAVPILGIGAGIVKELINSTTGGTKGAVANIVSGASGQFGGGGASGTWEERAVDVPKKAQKVAELGERIVGSGRIGDFNSAVVKPDALDGELRGALDQLKEDARLANRGTQLTDLSEPQADTNSLKVKITQYPFIEGSPNELIFNVMPKIDEQRSIDYDSIQPIHHPGAIQKYKNTSSRTWNISGKLISRNTSEATLNLQLINMIRAWAMPFYGNGTSAVRPDLLGAPPPVLTLSAYGKSMVGPVKCVLKSYNWSFDNGIDYIATVDKIPFPVMLDVSLSLDEAWSPAETSGFDIVKYKMGMLGDNGAFSNASSGAVSPGMPATSAAPPTNDQASSTTAEPKYDPNFNPGQAFNQPGV